MILLKCVVKLNFIFKSCSMYILSFFCEKKLVYLCKKKWSTVKHLFLCFKNSFGVFPLESSDNLSICSSQSMVLVPSATLNETNDQKFISKRVSEHIFVYWKVLMQLYIYIFFLTIFIEFKTSF